MKEILDVIVIIVFVFFVASFIIGFNKQQIQKHKDKLDEIQKQKNKENKNDKTTTY
ncbi:MAG: hypothetical protein WC149_02335 [Arcobacteraceae bacterium]|jgi:preprotein translocase subunit YajC